jgi:hypothetical protein
MTFSVGDINHRAFHNSSVTIGLDYATTLRVKKGGWQFIQITGSNGFYPTDAATLNVDLVDGSYNLMGSVNSSAYTEDQGEYWYIVFTQEATGNNSSGRSIICAANDLNSPRLPSVDADGEFFEIQYPNFNQSSYASSPINAPTGPAQREATIATASTFTEVGSAIDSPSDNGGANPCVLGNFNDVNYTNGVFPSSNALTFGGGGKYVSALDDVNDYDIGGVISNEAVGARVRVTSIFNTGGVIIERITPMTDQELIDWFGNDGTGSNKLTWDRTPSDYFTTDMVAFRLAIDTLRTNAGDNATWLASLPAPKQWPIDSFELVLDYTLLAIPEDNDVLFSGQVGNGSLERFNIYKTSADVVAVQPRVAGVDTIVNSGYLLTQPDERLTIIARLTGGQLTLEVNGMSNSGADGGVVTWGSEAGIAQKPDGSFRSPMKVNSLTIKDII